MTKSRCDTYEAQLDIIESEQLRKALLAPCAKLRDIRRTLPPWKAGACAGKLPSLRTLYRVAERMREEGLKTFPGGLGEVKRAVNRIRKRMPHWISQEDWMEDIRLALETEVMQKTIHGVDLPRRDEMLKLLLKLAELRNE